MHVYIIRIKEDNKEVDLCMAKGPCQAAARRYACESGHRGLYPGYGPKVDYTISEISKDWYLREIAKAKENNDTERLSFLQNVIGKQK